MTGMCSNSCEICLNCVSETTEKADKILIACLFATITRSFLPPSSDLDYINL